MINRGGEIVFYGGTGDGSAYILTAALYKVFGGRLVKQGDAAPDGNGVFDSPSGGGIYQISTLGQVAFQPRLTGTSGGSLDDQGIYVLQGCGQVMKAVRKNDLAPIANGRFSVFSSYALNSVKDGDYNCSVVFNAYLINTTTNMGIFRATPTNSLGMKTTPLAVLGQTVPGGNGKFYSFNLLNQNDKGEVAFSATMT